MRIFIESKKLKRTGFIAAILAGSLMAAMIPVLNMAVRSENFTVLSEKPLKILLDANWSMMSMINVLLVMIGACIMYHTEYADNAIQKMRALPINEGKMFFGKFILLSGVSAVIFAAEAAGIMFCIMRWFPSYTGLWPELLQNFGYMLLLAVPSAAFSLFTASVFQNMWITLGIGVVCVFLATMLPTAGFVFSLFPYALPFQTLFGAAENSVLWYCTAACAEIAAAFIAEIIYLKGRRVFA